MGHKNILQKQLRFKLKPREQNDSILNGGKMAFIGRECSCHLVLKCSRVLRFSSPPPLCAIVPPRHFHSEQRIFADMLGCICGRTTSRTSSYLAVTKLLMGPRCLASLAGITLHRSVCSHSLPSPPHPPPLPSGTCSLYKMQPSAV